MKKIKRKNAAPPTNTMMAGIFDNSGVNGVAPNSLPFQMIFSNAYNPITLNRVALTYAYMTHGIIQRAINQPIEDAFRGGVEIHSDELSAEDLEKLQKYLQKEKVLHTIKMGLTWGDLYGGAGIIINTDQNPKSELDEEAITEDSNLGFIAADRWEITMTMLNFNQTPCPYNYYNQPFHHSRIIRILGKEAPSFLRKRLQGWGMSKIEHMIRALNSSFKMENVIYELLDEAKIDVFKILGFNDNILSGAAQGKISTRMQVMNMQKNYHRALVLDKEDEYEQKNMTFSGLAEIKKELRIDQAAACNMPLTKLFGLSAAGFNSGEDDIENYNAMIESEIRPQGMSILTKILPLCCRKLFGFAPDDLKIEFKPLRVMAATDEENVKTAKANRYSTQYSQGMLTDQEYAEILRQEDLTPIDTEVLKGSEAEPPESPGSFEQPQQPLTKKIKGEV